MNWQQRFALSSTRVRWPTAWLSAWAISLAVVIPAIDWRARSAIGGFYFGFLVAKGIDLFRARTLREIIDAQSREMPARGDLRIPEALPPSRLRLVFLTLAGMAMIGLAAAASVMRLLQP
jgi:hypothetical protein